MSGYLPPNLAFVAKQVSNVSRNIFRLETSSTKNTCVGGDVITVNLPESALLDMKSFRWNFTASSELKGAGSDDLSVFPANMQSLIERVEVYINGVQVQNGCAQYNTVCQVLKIGRGNHDRHDSIENCLSKSHVIDQDATSLGSMAAPTKVSCLVDKWYGFLNETSTRFLDTSLLGQIQVRITLADARVMIPYKKLDTFGFKLTDSTPPTNLWASSSLNYKLEDMYFSIDSIVVDPMYSMALRDQLSREQFIPINYKEYYTYTLAGQASSAYQNRFALSTGSMDKLYAIQRPTTYNAGTERSIVNGEGGDAHVAKYFAFESLSENTDGYTGNDDNFKFTWHINNVQHGQYRQKLIEACADLAHMNDKCGDYSVGFMPRTLKHFKETQCVIPLQLNHAESPISVMSGYNSRGINSMCVFDVEGLDMTTNKPRISSSKTFESMVIVETTAQLRIASGRALAVSR